MRFDMKRIAFSVALLTCILPLAGCATQKVEEDPLSGPTFERAISLLRTDAQSPDPAVRANCIEALETSRDPRAIDIIEQGLHDREWVVRFAAAMASGK